MIDIRKSLFWKLIVFSSLYFSEGLMIALSTVLIPIYLIENGVNVEIVGFVVGISSIPWAAKFIFGGIVDYFSSYGRKIFILFGGFLASSMCLLLSILSPKLTILFTIILFLARSGVVFLDVSSDAFSIEVSKESERGKINGAEFGGQSAGLALGTLLLTYISKNFSYNFAFVINGLLILMAISISLFVRDLKTRRPFVSVIPFLFSEFRKKLTLIIAIFAPIASISMGILGILIPTFMKTILLLDVFQIGLISTTFSIASVFGAFVGGDISDRFGRKRSIMIFIILNAIFSLFLIYAHNWRILTLIWAACGFFQGGFTSILCAMFMDITNPRIGATQFSILTGLSNLGATIGNTVSGKFVSHFGHILSFAFSAILFLPSLVIIKFARLKR